jgi:hypothetical protein
MNREQDYMDIFLEPIRKCKAYKPKFGESQNEQGVSLSGFLTLYGSDPFYNWIGLDNSLMYAAHKAAGGMTSIYRQIGIGCEYLFREILTDMAQYEDKESAKWSYKAKTSAVKEKILSLDGRLGYNDIKNTELKNKLIDWVANYCKELSVEQLPTNGVVFEVRQGYKSKDSKRQNADIDNATVAWANGYLPIFAIFSSQIDSGIVLRYRNNRCGILIGSQSNNPLTSLFSFSQQVLGYDLAGFFQRNSTFFKEEVNSVLMTLLNPNAND